MSEKERVGITPKSWTGQRHHGVLHLGKRWYVLVPTSTRPGLQEACVSPAHTQITTQPRGPAGLRHDCYRECLTATEPGEPLR